MAPFFTGRKLNVSLLLALLLTLLLAVWLFSGSIYSSATEAPDFTPDSQAQGLPRVETRILQSQTYSPLLKLQGQLEPIRHLQLNSRLSSDLTAWHVRLGETVQTNQLLLSLDPEDRQAQLQRAEADLRVAEADLRAAERLQRQSLVSENDLLRLQASVATARAERDRLQLELSHTKIRAPFAGTVEALPVEVGSNVQPGDVLLSLTDTGQLKLTGQIPQQQVHQLTEGLAVEAILLDGRRLTGHLSFIASVADSQTRSYRIEALIDNDAFKRVAGASATLHIHLPDRQAHRFSAALLSLDDAGQTGVRVLDSDEKLVFLPVEILSLDTSGVWVSGLPDRVELVTQGAGFVEPGQRVQASRVEPD